MATEEPSGQWGQPHLTLGQWWLVTWPNWVGLSVWKLSLPQDLEEDAQLSDRGEEVGVPCPARACPSPEAPGPRLLASQKPGPSSAHKAVRLTLSQRSHHSKDRETEAESGIGEGLNY